MVKGRRKMTAEEERERDDFGQYLRKKYELDFAPQVIDYEANGSICYHKVLPDEKRLKMGVYLKFKRSKKQVYPDWDQIQVDITYERAKKLMKSLTYAFKRIKALKKKKHECKKKLRKGTVKICKKCGEKIKEKWVRTST